MTSRPCLRSRLQRRAEQSAPTQGVTGFLLPGAVSDETRRTLSRSIGRTRNPGRRGSMHRQPARACRKRSIPLPLNRGRSHQFESGQVHCATRDHFEVD